MKLKTPWTRDRLRSHLQYGLWKYALLIVLSIFAWDMVYAMTAYRPPQDKRIDLYIQSSTASQEALEKYLISVKDKVVPDMELVSAIMLMGSAQNDIYAAQQLTTYLMAGEGDIYLLSSADYKQYASQGVFLKLDELVADGTLQLEGIDLTKAQVAIQEYDRDRDALVPVSARHLYGIPAAQLFGLMEYGIDNRDMYLGVTTFNQNDENVLRFLNELVRDNLKPQPDFLQTDQKKEQP